MTVDGEARVTLNVPVSDVIEALMAIDLYYVFGDASAARLCSVLRKIVQAPEL